ncbi:ABC transporter substrate-binding protein [Curvivirga sp.]|uniref:ABC transporter substrate-binding protein n=1 Tax=Curvivirga sp. TaxID=2856848 RepID=UPI003B5A01F2
MKKFLKAAFISLAVFVAPSLTMADMFIDSDFNVSKVAKGKLPSVDNRLPDIPKIVNVTDQGLQLGHHGGTIRMAMRKDKDTRQMVVYGYARLVKYNTDLELEADILEDVEIIDGRIFRLKLRAGHKWSDGAPFTIEDFRYWWEDVANNEILYPSGPPSALRVQGHLPVVTFPFEDVVQYEWPVPNPLFLASLAKASPRYIYAPAHYLKKYHADYQDKDYIDQLVKEKGVKNWGALHNKYAKAYHNKNEKLPSLQPWVLKVMKSGERYEYHRNPYFHRVDENGLQLPYIDRWVFSITEKKLIPLKAGTGEVDLQGRYLDFNNISLLKQNEVEYGYTTRLWRNGKGSHMALFPNLNNSNPVWRSLLRDVRFRRALSLAINRYEINRVVYFGFAIEGQNTVLPASPLYQENFRTAYAEFDLEKANQLLDEIGLVEKDGRGIRKLPNGETLEIIVETTDTGPEQSDVLQLIADSWAKAGIALHIKPTTMDILKPRIYSGANVMTVFSGMENGMATADTPPASLAPIDQDHFQWPKWGQYVQTGGVSGEEPDMPAAIGLMQYYDRWFKAKSVDERAMIWHQMLETHANQVFSIGLIAGTLQPIVVSNKLMNVPEEAIWNWEPGAHFGLYNTDLFWFKD